MLSLELSSRFKKSSPEDARELNFSRRTPERASFKMFTPGSLRYRILAMGSPIFPLNLEYIAWRGISFSIAAAVVLGFIGPAVDHHFAERQHNHSHIYLTVSAAEHGHAILHPFEEPHSHVNSDTEATGHHGVLYQTSNEVLGDSGTGPVIAFIEDSARPIRSGDFLPNAQADNGRSLHESFIAPLKRPPRNQATNHSA